VNIFTRRKKMSTRQKILTIALIVVAGVFMLSAPNVLAGDREGLTCYGDFTNDGDVDATDLTTFLFHYGRGTYDDPCPPLMYAPVPKTGQTTSYASGDDGVWEMGVVWPNPRFTDNENGTVTDNLTGLIWLKNANCFGEKSWYTALSDCNGLADGEDCGTGGSFLLSDGSNAGDWRLPNKRELMGLTHDGYSYPAIPNTAGTGKWSEGDPFNNVQFSNYWSSTTFDANSAYAWHVDMIFGFVDTYDKQYSIYVWPVRVDMLCIDEETQPCGTDIGYCESGIETCGPDGTWGECVGEVQPSTEVCDDGIDNDCDGETDMLDEECEYINHCNGVNCFDLFGSDACCCAMYGDPQTQECLPDVFYCEGFFYGYCM
jgi:hypothetical protein